MCVRRWMVYILFLCCAVFVHCFKNTARTKFLPAAAARKNERDQIWLVGAGSGLHIVSARLTCELVIRTTDSHSLLSYYTSYSLSHLSVFVGEFGPLIHTTTMKTNTSRLEGSTHSVADNTF